MNKEFKHLSIPENECRFFESFLVDAISDPFGISNRPYIIDAAGLCICLSGKLKITIRTKTYIIKKGDMCVVLPNDIIYVMYRSEDFVGYTIGCLPNFLYSFISTVTTPIYLYVRNNPCISLNEEEQMNLIEMCDNLKKYDSRKDHPCRDEVSRYVASAIVYEVIGVYKKRKPIEQLPSSRKNRLYLRFIDLVIKNYKEEKRSEFYADKLCITSRYLSVICKEICGLTATECINIHIITNAQILLTSTDMTILQISDELNFPNPSFFTQYFKKHTGTTPKQYRNLNRS